MSDKPLPSSFEKEFFEEKPLAKLSRRLREEPLIPIGVFATCYALYRAYKSMKARDSVQLNKMFRARIYAQAFTLVAVCGGGMYYGAERKQQKELEKAHNEKKAQEKRDAWLRELEIRDKEDKEWRERHAAIGKVAKESEAMDLTWGQKKMGTPDQEEGYTEEDKVSSPVEEDLGKEKGGVLDAVKNLVWGNK